MTVMPGWQHRGRADRGCGYRGGGYVNLLAAKVIGGMDLELIRDVKNDGDRRCVDRGFLFPWR